MKVDKTQYIERQINGKEVFIFEDHSTAILPWRQITASLKETPFLITLDYHTDTMPAFKTYGNWAGKEDRYSANLPHVSSPIKQALLEAIDIQSHDSVVEILPKLRNDEHIDASIKSGILTHCFVIQYQDRTGTEANDVIQWREDNKAVSSLFNKIPLPERPFSYDLPKDKMFITPGECEKFNKKTEHHDLAIDDSLLGERLKMMKEMDSSSGLNSLDNQPYILDIDLDYFQTKASINPETISLFYKLIRKAEAITIAQEPSYVEALKKEDELTTEYLLGRMLEHIELATS